MMRTDDLIDLLAKQSGAVENPLNPLMCALSLGSAIAVSLLSAYLWLGFVPLSLFGQAGPWLKIMSGGALVVTCSAAFLMAGQPGTTHHAGVLRPALVFVVMAVLALGQLVLSDETERTALVWGHSWSMCPRNILVLSLPVLAVFLMLMRRLAPTNLAKAGAYAGLLAGAIGAMIYALSCTETAFPFIAVWYGAGILLTSAVGALAGPLLLRW